MLIAILLYTALIAATGWAVYQGRKAQQAAQAFDRARMAFDRHSEELVYAAQELDALAEIMTPRSSARVH
jgi:hypothetical protein